jgi:16S rRNA (adenine1518-N6/adenine1519-N6)-dimethyltransferase
MTYLSVAFATVGTVRLVRRVPPGAFFPPPRVQSAIVRIDLHAHPAVTVDSLERFLGFVRGGFCQPRQQLHNSLARGLGVDSKAARAVCEVAGIDEKRRPAELALEEWVALYERFAKE